MKRLLGFIFTVLVLAAFTAPVAPAFAMHEDAAQAIVNTAYQAVESTLAELEAANVSGDKARIELALQALDLALTNYSVANNHLAKIRSGEPVENSILETCNAVAESLGNFCSLLASNDIDGAQGSLSDARGMAAELPPPADPGVLPAGLAGQILAASSESAAILAGGSGGTAESLGTTAASPI